MVAVARDNGGLGPDEENRPNNALYSASLSMLHRPLDELNITLYSTFIHLRCLVTSRGQVTSPKGHWFDESAAEA